MQDLYQRPRSPFHDTAIERLRRMGLADADGQADRDVMAIFSNIFAGQFYDDLCDYYQDHEYDDGLYSGTLTFDATAILTEPSGYTNQSRTIKGTKTIGPVDRNDMSYVPATLR